MNCILVEAMKNQFASDFLCYLEFNVFIEHAKLSSRWSYKNNGKPSS